MAIHENKKYTLRFITPSPTGMKKSRSHMRYITPTAGPDGALKTMTPVFFHEIQMSGLIGGEEGAYENFKEFIDTENIPDNTVLKIMEIDALRKALSVLSDADNELVQALFYDGLTEQEYAAQVGISQQMINRKKQRILKLLKKLLSEGL